MTSDDLMVVAIAYLSGMGTVIIAFLIAYIGSAP
jgi:hypothetical protein